MTTAPPSAAAAASAGPGAVDDEQVPTWLWISMIAMMFGNFMALLDIQIVASAIGSIQAGIGASSEEISRVQSAYLIAEVVGIPLSGFLGRALGIRMLFTISALAFGLASVACALAWDLESLILFRAIQGFAGAPMVPTTMATMYTRFPLSKQAMAGAMIGLISSLGPTIGPTFGGTMAEHLGWRSLFWINVIPSIAIAALVWRFYRGDKPEFHILKKIDFIGLISMALFLGSIEHILADGPGDGWWSDGGIVMWSYICLFAGGIFYWRATSYHTPIVDLRPFGNVTFATGAALGFVIGIGLFGPIFLMPLFLGQVQGMNSEQIGHMMFAQGATMLFVAPVMGTWLRQLDDLRPVGFAGFIIVAASCWLQTQMTAQSGFWTFIIPQIMRGFGMMFMFMSVMQPALQALPPQLIQSATGLFNLCRNLGGALGLAILTTVQTHSFALHRQELYTGANMFEPGVQGMIAMQERHLESVNALDPHRQAIMNYVRLLDREALVMTFNDMFLFLTCLLLAGSCAIWLMRRSKTAPTDEERKAAREAMH